MEFTKEINLKRETEEICFKGSAYFCQRVCMCVCMCVCLCVYVWLVSHERGIFILISSDSHAHIFFSSLLSFSLLMSDSLSWRHFLVFSPSPLPSPFIFLTDAFKRLEMTYSLKGLFSYFIHKCVQCHMNCKLMHMLPSASVSPTCTWSTIIHPPQPPVGTHEKSLNIKLL